MKPTIKAMMMIGVLLTQMALAQTHARKPAPEGVEHGNGGSFTEQDIYMEISEIGNDLSNLKKLSFGIDGSAVLSELSSLHFLVVITDQTILDRDNKKKDAVNFAPNEINDQELAKFEISPSDRSKRIIVASRKSWGAQLSSGRSIKNLTAHELWGAMGVKDVGYQFTSPFFGKLVELSQNPTAWKCVAWCEGHGSVTSFGTSLKESFEDLKQTCKERRSYQGRNLGFSLQTVIVDPQNPWINTSEKNVEDAKQVCFINL